MKLDLARIAVVTGGRASGSASIDRLVADSRGDLRGALFVALPGDRQDGHDFVEAAFAAGAVAALVSRAGDWSGPAVVVSDTPEALTLLGTWARESFSGPVIGITGSSGKTCTKDFAEAVLDVRFRVHASPRSFNTEVGVPLTLLNAPGDTEAIVLEMGSRGIGHIRELCEVARPTIGVVTNVGTAHLGMFGSRAAIAVAKGELVEALGPDGVAVLNADDSVVAGFGARTPGRVLTFGVAAKADVRADHVTLDADARPSFTLTWEGTQERVELAVPGEHMVTNALAAAAIGLVLGVSPAECAGALKGASVSGWRMEVHDRPDGVRIVNDAYNANPASMAAALKAARWMARDRRCVAVLGEMAELGPTSVEEHEHVGDLVARLGIEELVTVGEPARATARGAVREGIESQHVHEVATVDEALAVIRELVRPGDVVVVKASRSAGLERVAAALLVEGGAAA